MYLLCFHLKLDIYYFFIEDKVVVLFFCNTNSKDIEIRISSRNSTKNTFESNTTTSAARRNSQLLHQNTADTGHGKQLWLLLERLIRIMRIACAFAFYVQLINCHGNNHANWNCLNNWPNLCKYSKNEWLVTFIPHSFHSD